MHYKIAGCDVEFPHQAYGVQLSYMNCVLRALNSESNALLEAPTGCGKTLSLLCAALAWQRRWKEEAEAGMKDQEPEDPQPCKRQAEDALPSGEDTAEQGVPAARRRRGPPPKIYYGSRTHSQIAQVMKGNARCP